MSQAESHGITGAVSVDVPVMMVMVAFSTIALYNVLELNVIIFTTFKRRKGLYFWSFVVATWGIVPHTVGFILKFFGITSAWWAPLILISVGCKCHVPRVILLFFLEVSESNATAPSGSQHSRDGQVHS